MAISATLPEIVRVNAAHFRDELRSARSRAIADAEDFHHLLYAIEHLGCALSEKIAPLGDLVGKLIELASASPLGRVIPKQHRACHLPASSLLHMLRPARNDALHQGAYARHLTNTAIDLAIILVDALMNGANRACAFMVRNPICAEPWQPMSFIRRQMLAHSFSFVPVYFSNGKGWCLVSDLAVAKYLRKEPEGRKERLGTSLETAVSSHSIELCNADRFGPDAEIGLVVSLIKDKPVLITKGDGREDLLGILTAFDLL